MRVEPTVGSDALMGGSRELTRPPCDACSKKAMNMSQKK